MIAINFFANVPLRGAPSCFKAERAPAIPPCSGSVETFYLSEIIFVDAMTANMPPTVSENIHIWKHSRAAVASSKNQRAVRHVKANEPGLADLFTKGLALRFASLFGNCLRRRSRGGLLSIRCTVVPSVDPRLTGSDQALS